MCGCREAPIGNVYSKENLHINWSNETKKNLDTAPEWATALVEADSGDHLQTYWVDSLVNPKFCNVKGRFCGSPIPIANDFKVVHVWQVANQDSL